MLWTLRDLSFDVKRGEVGGVIGHNGAAKSTLLKILSRITEPTEGVVEPHGRVGSLLEVGSGFHPELTGGENIYLNGVILGMKRREIERKFEEIVAFAQVEKYIDRPVKHYSSGMYLQLAFVRRGNGSTSAAVDIRKPVGIEMEFDVLEPGWILSPIFDFFNKEGLCLFCAMDQGPEWRNRPRPAGRFVSTAWIPGNFLADGTVLVHAVRYTFEPMKRHFKERHAVAFEVIDSLGGNSARGGFAGTWDGVVRPLLEWTTRFSEPEVGVEVARERVEEGVE